MTLITHFIAFIAGGAVVWFFKSQVTAELNALHVKVDALIASLKAKV